MLGFKTIQPDSKDLGPTLQEAEPAVDCQRRSEGRGRLMFDLRQRKFMMLFGGAVC